MKVGKKRVGLVVFLEARNGSYSSLIRILYPFFDTTPSSMLVNLTGVLALIFSR